jgi:hypothetical protein
MAALWARITDIPAKILINNVLPFCEAKDVLSLGCTNKFFALVTTDDMFWRQKLAVDYNFPGRRRPERVVGNLSTRDSENLSYCFRTPAGRYTHLIPTVVCMSGVRLSSILSHFTRIPMIHATLRHAGQKRTLIRACGLLRALRNYIGTFDAPAAGSNAQY